MKTILKKFFLALTIIFTLMAKAQILSEKNKTILNPNLEKYAGTWKWENEESSFTLILNKVFKQLIPTADYKADMLIGYHEYRKDGTIIESSLNLENSKTTKDNHTIIGLETPNNNEVILSITDSSHKRNLRTKVIYIDATHIKIISYYKVNLPRLSFPGRPYRENPPIDFPSNIILTKQ